MKESELENDVVEWAESQGGFALKLKIEGQRGWPDRTILLPDHRIVFAELKRPNKNRYSINQEIWIRRLINLGFPAGFYESLDDVKGLLKLV